MFFPKVSVVCCPEQLLGPHVANPPLTVKWSELYSAAVMCFDNLMSLSACRKAVPNPTAESGGAL